MMKNNSVNKVATVNRGTNTGSENVEQIATEQQSYQNYRLNDKLFANYKGRQSSNTILAYTGNNMHNKEVHSTEEDNMTKYQYKPDNSGNMLYNTRENDMIKYQYKPDNSDNMFYAGNLDNPYFTRVTVSR